MYPSTRTSSREFTESHLKTDPVVSIKASSQPYLSNQQTRVSVSSFSQTQRSVYPHSSRIRLLSIFWQVAGRDSVQLCSTILSTSSRLKCRVSTAVIWISWVPPSTSWLQEESEVSTQESSLVCRESFWMLRLHSPSSIRSREWSQQLSLETEPKRPPKTKATEVLEIAKVIRVSRLRKWDNKSEIDG